MEEISSIVRFTSILPPAQPSRGAVCTRSWGRQCLRFRQWKLAVGSGSSELAGQTDSCSVSRHVNCPSMNVGPETRTVSDQKLNKGSRYVMYKLTDHIDIWETKNI